jgi:hypothetical protein
MIAPDDLVFFLLYLGMSRLYVIRQKIFIEK